MSSHQNKKPKNDSAAPELPGFYYDAEKKRYFKIQNNSFGQTNIPTSESIKNREKRCEVDKSVKVQIKSRERALIDNLFTREVSGLNRDSFSDLQLQYAKLISLGRYKYRLNDRLSESSFFKISTIETAEKTLLLATYKRESEKYAAIFEVCIGLKANEQGLKPMRFLFEHSWEAINTKSSLPIYCDGHNRLVFSINSIESNRQKSTLYICKFDLVGNECLLKATSPSDFIKFEYENSHLLCSKISSDGAKLAAGLTNGVVVRTINAESDSGRIRLNVKDSDCFCLDFRADSNHFLFAGCSDRSIYGFDLRKSTKRSDVQFIHRSIVNDLIPHSLNDNYLFSNEYNGEVSLWDMRFTKERVGLYNDKCQSDSNSSIKLDKSCKYLYQIPKDGHVRIYDVKSSRLIRTILSPFAKQDHETYAQIPDICFTNSSDIIYAIKDYVYMFKC